MTLVNEAGWHVDLSDMRCGRATPLQYLERLDAAFQLFGDDIRFEGFDEGPGRHDRRLRTSQRDIEGESPSMDDLVTWLESRGFEEQPGLDIGAYFAKTFRRGNAWLFDVRPPNFIEAGGVMFPIDVIVVFEPQRKLLRQVLATRSLSAPAG